MPSGFLAVLAGVLLMTGCPTVDQGEPPVTPGLCMPDPVLFETRIWPEAIVAPAPSTTVTCLDAGCHRRADGRSALRLIPDPTTPSDWSQNYDVVTRFLNCSTPSASPFLTKPGSSGDPHNGGDLWDLGAAPALCVEQWISGMACTP